MTDRTLALSFLLTTSSFGLISLLADIRECGLRLSFALEFNEKLRRYIESRGDDGESYGWLIHRSNKMQNHMGGAGVFASFKPPYANYAYSNYPIILNMVPALRRTFGDDYLATSQIAQSYAGSLLETTVRHIGNIEDRREALVSKIKNPLVWFATGVQLALSIPVRMLGWFGVMGNSIVATITSSLLFKSVAALVGIIGFASSVVGLVTGWDPFISLLNSNPITSELVGHILKAKK